MPVVTGPAGQQGVPISGITTYYTEGAILLLRVRAGNGKSLDRQAVVKLDNEKTKDTVWRTTDDQSQASFGDLQIAHYDIEVSAVGYLTARKNVNVPIAYGTYNVDVILEPDPQAVELNAPGAAQMPAKARKETQRAVTALKSANYKEAQKHLDAAYKLVPNSADVNFLLGYLAAMRRDFDHAEDYLRTASTLDPHNVQAQTLRARILLQRDEYEAARPILEQAVDADPEYWMAHDLLANVYLKQHEYEKAAAQARLAMEKGKGAGNSAQLVLGEALANLGHEQEGIQALKAFLQDAPASPTAPEVREMITELERRISNADQAAAAGRSASFISTDPLLNVPDPRLSIKTWEPPGVDDVKPYVAADVTCPAQQVIDATSARAKQLVDDVSQIAAIEDLVHERVDELGTPESKETRKYDYVATISEPQPGWLSTDEYRTDQTGIASFPDQIGTQGFTALALVFHPDMRDNFQMTCEGLGDWHGQATWLVYFRQRDDRPNRIHSYRVSGVTYLVGLKGRAWITADTYQIVHMESELVKPMPKIQLLSEHQIVDYGPVQFEKKNVQLWLPKSAQIYFDFRKHRYVRRHTFDHYMLFAVDATDKPKPPKAAETTTTTQPPQ